MYLTGQTPRAPRRPSRSATASALHLVSQLTALAMNCTIDFAPILTPYINPIWLAYLYVAGRSVRAFRIQLQPHSCRTRAGSACHAFRIGSSASCLACRAG